MRLLSMMLAALTGVGLAAGWTGSAAAAPVQLPAAAADRPVPASTVRLITGDLVTVRTDGPRDALSVEPRDRTGLAAQFITMRRGSERFLFPAAALPYLRHGLDPALFDVTELARAGRNAPDARLAVQLTYRARAVHRAIPGVTVTRTAGDTAEGYLTAASAQTFGAALVAQARTDLVHPASRGLGIFTGLTGIRPAGAAAITSAVTPPAREQMVTLRITVTGPEGKPAALADIVGANVDDVDRAIFETQAVNGVAEISVPTGNYGFIVFTIDPDTEVKRIVTVTDLAVTARSGGVQTLSIDMGDADQPLSGTTPRPAEFASALTELFRSDPAGDGIGIGTITFDEQAPILLAPAPAARVGTLSYVAVLQFVSPAGTAVPYAYDLTFGGLDGVPADVHYEVAEADLATLNNAYYTDGGPPGQPGSTMMFGFLPWQVISMSAIFPFTVPGRRIDYVTGRDDAVYQAIYWRGAVDAAGNSIEMAEEYDDSGRQYTAGQQVAVDWGRQPLRPGPVTETVKLPPTAFRCPICREDDTIRLRRMLQTDSFGHLGFVAVLGDTPLGPVDVDGRLQLFAGDTLLADESSQNEFEAAVPGASTRYRLVLDQKRLTPWTTTGVRSVTKWGFTSAHPTVSAIPEAWRCGSLFDPPPAVCAVLPLLLVSYDAPVDLVGVARGGPTHLGIAVAPTQGAPATAITSVAVDVSFDDGATWTPAAVLGSGGRYDAVFTAPTSGFVTTRVQATDSAGNTVSQAITRAYALGPAS